jgi:apolipoprotein D and lipocalin family protein
MSFSFARFLPSALAALLLAGCISNRKPLPAAVASVDLDRYMGRWFVISHVPYFLEKGKVASYDTYARRPDGKLTNNFTFREKTLDGPEKTWEGTARIIDPASNATWKVSFFWPVSVTYKVFALDPNYGWAVVGTNDGGLLWVLSRERRLPPATYAAIVAELKASGLPAEKLEPVPQPLS